MDEYGEKEALPHYWICHPLRLIPGSKNWGSKESSPDKYFAILRGTTKVRRAFLHPEFITFYKPIWDCFGYAFVLTDRACTCIVRNSSKVTVYAMHIIQYITALLIMEFIFMIQTHIAHWERPIQNNCLYEKDTFSKNVLWSVDLPFLPCFFYSHRSSCTNPDGKRYCQRPAWSAGFRS